MKAVIWRAVREPDQRGEHDSPKPMVEIGGKPILWHIMKLYGTYNVEEFVICAGYRGDAIREYFANYALHTLM